MYNAAKVVILLCGAQLPLSSRSKAARQLNREREHQAKSQSV